MTRNERSAQIEQELEDMVAEGILRVDHINEEYAPSVKAQVLRDLDTLVVSRLFGNGPWLVDAETAPRISNKLCEMGLEEVISDDGRTTRSTAFGREQHCDLQMVFMGLFEPWDALWVLEDYGLIDADERDRLQDCVHAGADPELFLRDRVRRAYYEYYCPRGYRL
jgi:hypothetical protein